MKRLSVMLLILTLLCGIACAEETISAPPKHDMKIFEKLERYDYDKFDKDWSCHGAFLKEYSDATIVLGLQIYGDNIGPTFVPYIYAWYRDADNINVQAKITGVDILINDVLYSFKNMEKRDTLSLVFLGEKNGKELVKALAKAEEISFRLNYAANSVSYDLDKEAYEATKIKELAQAIVEFDIWSYIDDPDVSGWESSYPLTIIK